MDLMRIGYLLTIVHGGTRTGNLVPPRRVFYHYKPHIQSFIVICISDFFCWKLSICQSRSHGEVKTFNMDSTFNYFNRRIFYRSISTSIKLFLSKNKDWEAKKILSIDLVWKISLVTLRYQLLKYIV